MDGKDLNRPKWATPSIEHFENELLHADERTRNTRALRLKFVQEEFGPPTDMLLVGGIPAMFALHEMVYSYVAGNFMATVLLAQVFIEHSLGGSYILAGDDETATSGLSKLINESLSRGNITCEMAKSLQELRKIRNPYSHPNPGATPRSHMGRMMEKKIYDPDALAEQDAKLALQTVVDFIRHESPDWYPGTEDSGASNETSS
jgi:hypothetical protein